MYRHQYKLGKLNKNMEAVAKKSKYQVIYNQLKAQIKAGIFSEGNGLPSEMALAKEYGASRLTVRRAISQLVADNMVKTIQGKGSFVSASRPVRETALKTVHFLTISFNTEPDPLLQRMILALSKELTQKGWSLTVSLLDKNETLSGFISKQGIPPTFKNGLIISSLMCTSEDLKILKKEKIPFVVLPAHNINFAAPIVGTDDYAGIRQCVDFLLKYGHKKIALFSCQPNYHACSYLLNSYRDSLKEAGISFDPDLVVTTTPWDKNEGRNSMQKLLSRKTGFSAVLTFGDQATVGAVNLLLGKGFKIPEDISVMTYDRYSWMDAVLPFKLSGVEQDVKVLSTTIIDVLAEQRLTGKVINREVMINPELFLGNSCQYKF